MPAARRPPPPCRAPLVGRIEGSQGVDLVTEPLDPHRHRLSGGEDVDDAATSGELAAATDLWHVLIAQVDESPNDTIRARSAARSAV